MVKLDYVVLNAFTSSPSSGNPAAVTILPSPGNVDQNDLFSSYPPTPALQAVATKLNYPMTAFLLPLSPSEGKYALRWLDPGTEVQLCGHATIALSEYLFSLPNAPRQLDLQTVKHGQVISEQLSNPFEESDKRVALDFPQILGFSEVVKSSQEWEEVEKGLREVTGVEDLPLACIAKNDHYVIVEFEKGFDMSAKGLPLNMDKLSNFEGTSVLLTQPAPTASSREGPHIHTRVLHALAKKDEDAATGSAHCALIPYYLTSSAHTSTFHSEVYDLQAVSVNQQSREGGEMIVQWLKEREKVRIFGNAVRVGQGEIELDM